MSDNRPQPTTRRRDVRAFLSDPSKTAKERLLMLKHLVAVDSPDVRAVLGEVLDSYTGARSQKLVDEKLAEVQELLDALESGPLRRGTFLEHVEGDPFGGRVTVVLGDGSEATCTAPRAEVAKTLRCGDAVMLDAKCRALLGPAPSRAPVGETARFERHLGDGRIEASSGPDARRLVFRCSAALRDRIEADEVEPGAQVLVCQHRMLALGVVPRASTPNRYDYLATDAIPDVRLERDIGDPHPFVAETIEHLRTELCDPDLARRYGLQRARTLLLAGVSGSGKSLHIQALHRELYVLMSEVTGLSIDALPQRVFRLKPGDLLSKYFGESEQRIDRAFDEIEALAAARVQGADGEERELPVLVVVEEADGLGRLRGSSTSDVYDRVQTAILQRLDVTTQKLRDRMVVLVFSTNVPHLVDPAFMRRMSGKTIRFGRLTERSFVAILDKRLGDLPIRGATPQSRPARSKAAKATARTELVAKLAGWLFASGDETAIVELQIVGSTQPLRKRPRDFLTGALVDRAVQDAASRACRLEALGSGDAGIDAALLMDALQQQVEAIADQLLPENASDYLTLPEGARVANVRRLDSPFPIPALLERAS